MTAQVYSNPPYPTTTLAGISLTATNTSASGPKHAVGTVVHANHGAKFEYQKALSTVAAYNAVGFFVIGSAQTTIATGVAPLTITNSAAGKKVGFAQVAIASGDYGWVQTGGTGGSVSLLTGCQPAVNLFATATAGCLDDAVSSQACVLGVVAATSASSGTSIVGVVAGDAPVCGFNGGN